MLKDSGYHENRIIHNALNSQKATGRKYPVLKDPKYSSKYHNKKNKMTSSTSCSSKKNSIPSKIGAKGRNLASNNNNKARHFERNRREYKMSNYQFGQFSVIKYQNNPINVQNTAGHYKIDTQNGVIYETKLQPTIIRKYGGQLSIKSPPSIQGMRINAYSGYNKQKLAEQRARERNLSKESQKHK